MTSLPRTVTALFACSLLGGSLVGAQAVPLASTQQPFGVGCPASSPPEGFVLSFGIVDQYGEPVATIYDDLVIAPSSATQTIDRFPADDQDFAALAAAVNAGTAPPGQLFGYRIEFPPSGGCLAGGFPIAFGACPQADVQFFRLEIPPFSIGSDGAVFQIVPSGNFTVSAFGQPPGPDADGDCVPDDLDSCPSQPGSRQAAGCPDADGDGVPDAQDVCPSVPGLPQYAGCPDSDDDGIPDQSDACPYEPGPPQYDGCPDTDGDGIIDPSDACPDVPGLPQYAGCPDSDGDGVPDQLDDCPATFDPQQSDTDADGLGDACDPDDDNDGVPDAADHCPLVHHGGFDADGDGCRDTLAGFVAYVAAAPGIADSVRKTILAKSGEVQHLLCAAGNLRGGIQKLRDIASYVAGQRGKKVPPETARVLVDYVDGLIVEVETGRDVCA